MTADAIRPGPASAGPTSSSRSRVEEGLRRRYAAEARFKAYGIASILVGLAFLVIVFTSIIQRGYTSFVQSSFQLNVLLDKDVIDPSGTRAENDLLIADYGSLATDALVAALKIDPKSRNDVRLASQLLSGNADVALRNHVLKNPGDIGKTVPFTVLAHGNVDSVVKDQFDRTIPEARRKLNDRQLGWIDQAVAQGVLSKRFNTGLFTNGASSQPESAGIGVALIGSLFMMMTVVLLAVPIGVAAAVYLEEFAPKGRLADIIEVNINNLAAVPSIVFGILGLAVFINFFGLPRSASIVGGLVLALMTLPTIIIVTRAALTSVPSSIREAALGIGASKHEMIFHHVLPLAMPSILTGTIIGLAQALGETAPLLLIGMNAFITSPPAGVLEASTALPTQIYIWADSPERGFVARTSAAILVLLGFLVIMNGIAIFMRQRFERRW